MIVKFKKIFYYFFGVIVAKHFYPRFNFNSKFYFRPGSIGWEWLFNAFYWQKIRGINRSAYWPVSFRTTVVAPNNIIFHPDDIQNFMTSGNYFQANDALLIIGKGTFIAPNTAIITGNHDINDPALRLGGKNVTIGKKCWLGFGSIILPGVELGDHTVVAAGAVVTKSFKEGYCVIGGNPAKIIKQIK